MTGMRIAPLLLVLIGFAAPSSGDEGFWPYNHLPAKLGQTEWIERLRGASVRIGGGCSGSFVSDAGLVLTNQHCVRSCLAQLSSPGKDLIAPGYRGGEIRCPTMELRQLVSITDVSARMKDAIAGLSGAALRTRFDAERAAILAEQAQGPNRNCEIVPLHQGALNELYCYRRFDDVRLVFAPEADIAFFGGDPDNYNFPRYALDIAFLRVYADGRPHRPEQILRPARTSVREGDNVYLSGHPSSTSRGQPMAVLDFDRSVALPDSIAFLSEKRGLLTAYAARGANQMQAAATPLFRAENHLKVMKGRLQALNDEAFWAGKRDTEEQLRARIAADPSTDLETRSAWDAITNAVAARRILHDRFVLLEEGRGFQSELFQYARTLLRAETERTRPSADRLPEYADANLAHIERTLAAPAPIDPGLEVELLSWSLATLRAALTPDDPLVRALLGRESPRAVAERLVNGSSLADAAVRQNLYRQGIGAADDPMIALARIVDAEARAVRKRYEAEVEAPMLLHGARIARARFALDGFDIYPDATGTLRLSFGKAVGWTTPSGTSVPYRTDFAGMARRATGALPFALPPTWVRAMRDLDPATPFNFVSTSDTVGGSSGSPVVNAKGELVGVHFDGNIHATGREYGDNPGLDRAVAVDVAAIRAALHLVYREPALLAEFETGHR